MKKISAAILFLLFFASLYSEFISSESSGTDFVPKEIAFSVAEKKITSLYKEQVFFFEPIGLCGLDDSLYAYMFLFSFDNSILDLKDIFAELENRKTLSDEKALSLSDKAGYIIISARYENNVILEYSLGIPYALSNFASVKNRFRLQESGKIYYTGHGRFFYENGKEVFDLAEFKTYSKTDYVNSKSISGKWKSVLSNSYGFSDAKSTAYIPDVPFVLWSYGCSPTTSSMIFSYYDSRGYGDFVDYYFTRFDDVMGIYRNNVPSAQRELSILMYTDSVIDGGTSVTAIKNANQNFANSSHPYSFVCGSHIYGQTFDNFFYPYIKAEVDSSRPAHWAVLDYYYEGEYIGHSVVSIGYDDGGSDTLIQIHNTWDYTEPFWNLYTNVGGNLSYSCFYEIKPAGGNSYRKGNLNIDSRKYFTNLKGPVNFSNLSDSLNSIKLYYSTDNFAHKNYIGESFDTLFILTPSFSGSANLSAEFLKSGGSILATDGTYSALTVASIDDTHNLDVLSYTSDNANAFSSKRIGDTLIVFAGDGIREYLTVDESMPQLIYDRNDGLTYKFIEFVNDSIIAAGTENCVLTIKRKTGYSDIDTFYPNGSIVDMKFKDNSLFAVCPLYFYVLNLNPDFTITPADTFSEGTRKQFTSVCLNDSFVYLTDLLNGIHIMKTQYPSAGFYGNALTLTAYNEAFADIKNDTLYLACLNSGVSTYSILSDGSLSFIANYPIGTINKVEALQSGIACFNYSLGASVRRYSTMSDLSHIYMNSKVTDIEEDFASGRLYFSDNSNGLFIASFNPMAGIDENYFSDNTEFRVKGFSNSNIIIDYHINSTDFGKATVFDIAGRTLHTEDICFRSANSSVSLNKNFKPGVYFVRIDFKGRSETSKTNIVK